MANHYTNGPISHAQYTVLTNTPAATGQITCAVCNTMHPLSWYLCGKGNRVTTNTGQMVACLVCRGVGQGWTTYPQVRPGIGWYFVVHGGQQVRVHLSAQDFHDIVAGLEKGLGYELAAEQRVMRGTKRSRAEN